MDNKELDSEPNINNLRDDMFDCLNKCLIQLNSYRKEMTQKQFPTFTITF